MSVNISDNVMREAANLYLRMHKCGLNVKPGVPEINERPWDHWDALHREAWGRFEGFMNALRALDLVRFDGSSMTPYRTLEDWLFQTGRKSSSQMLDTWAQEELDRMEQGQQN